MPYYQFNSFTGRLAESTHPQPFYPLSPNRLDRVEPPKIMYATPDTKPVKVMSATKSEKFLSTVAPDLLKKMEKFQANNNLPVHLKGGTGDKIFLGVTVALIAVGLVSSSQVLYELSFPKK